MLENRNSLKLFFIVALIFFGSYQPTYADSKEGEKFNPSNMIMHHIADAHEWHFTTLGGKHLTIPLPIILYSPDGGLHIFSSSAFHNETHSTTKGNNTYILAHEHITEASGKKVYDFSITKNIASMLISVILLVGVFMITANSYKKNHGRAPKGIQSFFEPIIIFVRDEIAKPNIGAKHERYMPYLLTLFFFIWFNNMLGLLPGGANLTGNITVTLILSVITLVVTLFSSNKNYWAHIFKTPGVPTWLAPIMIPVELIGIITKPFSLMVRLFANITAGHIIILSLLALIFILESVWVGPVSVAFAVAMNFLELFVALLQAYVFTLLSSMYIGSAVEEHHHEEAH